MKKELHKIKLLVAIIKDETGATENEKQVSKIKIVKYCKKLISQYGIDAHKMENWILSGMMRTLFENEKATLHLTRELKDIEKLKRVLKFHKINFKENDGTIYKTIHI